MMEEMCELLKMNDSLRSIGDSHVKTQAPPIGEQKLIMKIGHLDFPKFMEMS